MTFPEAVGIIGSIPLPDDLVNDRILDAFGVLKDEAKKKVPKKPIVNNFDETQAEWNGRTWFLQQKQRRYLERFKRLFNGKLSISVATTIRTIQRGWCRWQR